MPSSSFSLQLAALTTLCHFYSLCKCNKPHGHDELALSIVIKNNNGLARRLIDDVNSSQLGEAQYVAHLANLARSITGYAARHSNASRYKPGALYLVALALG